MDSNNTLLGPASESITVANWRTRQAAEKNVWPAAEDKW